ncbi:hypothetical protein GGI02_003239, partial [Coemansia sp. RSA 2322]
MFSASGRASTTTAPTSSDGKAKFRQSWSSDEPASSSNSVSSKESSSLWSKLRRQASRLHVSHARQQSPPPSALSTAAGPAAHSTTTLSATAGSVPALRPRTAPSTPQTLDRHTSAPVPIVPSTLLAPSASATMHAPSQADRMRLMAALGHSSNIPNMHGSSQTWSAGLASPHAQSRRSPIAHAAFDVAPKPSGARSSTEVLRTTGTGDGRQRPAYSMDVPRTALNPAPSRQPGGPEISADSIRRSLSAYTGKTDVRGKPRLRRLMLLPQSGGSSARRPLSRDRDSPASALACIAEDDEHPASAPALGRPREASIARFSPAGHSAECHSALPPQALPPLMLTPSPPPPMPVSFNSDSLLQVYRHDSKRFSENSGSTVSSGDTLDTTSDQADNSGHPRPASRTASLARAQPRPPRLSFSTAQRPTAIYECADVNIVPSPTKEHPPRLVPMVHGHVTDPDMLLDPTVYRNTFFNARPATDQQHIEATLLTRRPSTGNQQSGVGKSLYKSASDETLNTGGSNSKRGSNAGSAKVRFSEHSDLIPDPLSDDKPASSDSHRQQQQHQQQSL